MNKIIKFLFVTCIGLILFSCTRDDEKATFNNTNAPSLSADKTSIVLVKENNDAKAITFSWERPKYNPNLVAKNQIEIALKGSNFATPKVIEVDASSNSLTYTVLELNQLLLSMNIPFSATDMEVRIKSSFPSAVEIAPIYSNVLSLTVTPYALISYLYAVGEFQGWNVIAAQALVSATSNGIYIGYLNFTKANSEFLIVPTQDNEGYANKYGSNDNLHLIKSGGDNLKSLSTTGYQKITVNLNNLTFSLAPYQISMIGSATPGGNWSTDIDMVWDDTLLKWKGTAIFLAGEFKFRLNHAWDPPTGGNWGGSGGVASTSGGNIPITAGTHTVTFDPVTLAYIIN
jgi:hypothetical protein